MMSLFVIVMELLCGKVKVRIWVGVWSWFVWVSVVSFCMVFWMVLVLWLCVRMKDEGELLWIDILVMIL